MTRKLTNAEIISALREHLGLDDGDVAGDDSNVPLHDAEMGQMLEDGHQLNALADAGFGEIAAGDDSELAGWIADEREILALEKRLARRRRR